MLVRLLGPVDVTDDEGIVRHSGSALRRALLALLALRCGRVVAPDWLLEHLWAGDAPDSGLRALRFHVSQLRREIGDLVPIETRPGGYCLELPERFGRRSGVRGPGASSAARVQR